MLVIGANEGDSPQDPSFSLLASESANHLAKVFVEPVPSLFASLQLNIEGMPRATAMQLAVSNTSGAQDIYCLGFDPSANATENLPNASHPRTWPKGLLDKVVGSSKRRKSKVTGVYWWSQVCSLSRTRLFNSDLAVFFAHRSQRAHADTPELLDKVLSPFIERVSVPVVTVPRLLELVEAQALGVHEASAGPIRYVQIDVEGNDDIVLRGLPLTGTNAGHGHHGTDGVRAFRPIIVFEYVELSLARATAACDLLHDANYAMCIDEQNVVAIPQTPT